MTATQTLVYRYGSPKWVYDEEGRRARNDLHDIAVEQLVRAHRLANELVALHLDHQRAVAETWDTRPEVAEAHTAHEQALDRLAETKAAVADHRSRQRTRTAPDDLVAAVKAARAEAKAARARWKAAKQAAYESLKPVFEQLKQELKAAVTAARQQAASDGLYWGTYNLIMDSYQRSARAEQAARVAGRPAQIRFRRWQGEGTLMVQLQRPADAPPRDPFTLARPDGRWKGQVRLPGLDPDEWALLLPADRRRAVVAIRVGSDGREPVWQHLTVSAHRPLPGDADITDVRLTRRRAAGQSRLQLAVTCRLPAVEPASRPGRVAVDIGWRAMPEGSIRVAVWHADAPPPPVGYVGGRDSDFTGSAVRVTGRSGEIRIPAGWVDEWRRMDGVAARRGKNLELLRGDLAAAWADRPNLADLLEATTTDLARWRSPARFARLAMAAREALPSDDPVARRLNDWRRHDRHLWEWHTHTTAQLRARRTELYRCVAAAIASAAGEITVERPFVGEVTRRPAAEQVDDHQAERARWQAMIAAPHTLLAAFKQACQRRGVTFDAVDAAGTTAEHHGCPEGGQFRRDELRAGVWVTCPACGRRVDQDHNAAQALLARASGPVVS